MTVTKEYIDGSTINTLNKLLDDDDVMVIKSIPDTPPNGDIDSESNQNLEKTSFFEIDRKIFNDKNRWINFVNFTKKLQNEMQSKYNSEICNFWSSYIEDNKTPLIPWIDKTNLQESQEKINADKDRQHTSCFRNIKINKKPLKIDKLSIFDSLLIEFPNFKEVIQYYKGFFALSMSRPEKNYIAPRPILLLGNPGIGKTRFAKSLAQLFNTSYKMLDCNSITSGAVLTGHNASWRGAEAGLIFRTLAPSDSLSPIVLLDEVDKMTNREHSPFSTLHQLLEPENSSTIFDEFLELEFNASFIIYILTANDAKNIPESLLSRMNVFEIKNPDQEQMKIISQNIFIELLAESKMFKPKLSDNMLTSLIDKSPRDVFQILSRNLFNLSAEQKKKTNNDFSLIQQDKKEVKFGF